MLVSSFMIPADKVFKVAATDTIAAALDIVVDRHVSSVLVVDGASKPVGIVTKTDLVKAYQQGRPTAESVAGIMRTDVPTILDTKTRDDAAKTFERKEAHHALVVDGDGNFSGLISTWDVASECAKDARAWPWTRTQGTNTLTDVH
jgi:CBS domain-containing protein